MSYLNMNPDKTSTSKQEPSSLEESKDSNGPNIALPKANQFILKLYTLSNRSWVGVLDKLLNINETPKK